MSHKAVSLLLNSNASQANADLAGWAGCMSVHMIYLIIHMVSV